MMRMRPIVADATPAEQQFDLLYASLRAAQAASPTARAAGEMGRARTRLAEIVLLQVAEGPDEEDAARRCGRFHRLAGPAAGKPR